MATAEPTPISRVLAVTFCATLAATLLELALYLRLGPYAAPYVLNVKPYLGPAIAYAAFALLLASSPFFAWAFLALRQRRSFRLGGQLHTALLFVLLTLSQLDHELTRFLGVRLSFDLLRTYASLHRTPSVIWDSLATDTGGAWSAALLFVIPFGFVPLGAYAAQRFSYTPRPWFFVILGLVGLVLPAQRLSRSAGGKGREKVAPLLVLALRGWDRRPSLRGQPLAPSDRQTYQAYWRDHAGNDDWEFFAPEYPLRRRYVGPASAVAPRPNFVLLLLETFRAVDMARFNPKHTGPRPTPYLDALAEHAQSAYYPRFYANAVPTVYAFMALHTSTYGHSESAVATRFAQVELDALPNLLRKHGYRTLHFTGTDPDWDSQRLWLQRWYDETYFSPADHGVDRVVFQKARERIRAMGRSGMPFLATVVSISNHTPFRNPEPALAITPGRTPQERIRNTMRYTDDVVRELIEGLRSEPWFANTVFVITGDHAFDLGERGEMGGMRNLHHETTWVPLILHGADPRLPRGRSERVASHVDIGPTLLDLAAVRDPVSHVGHSLIGAPAAGGSALSMGRDRAALEGDSFSVVFTGRTRPFVYDGADVLQLTPLRGGAATAAGRATNDIYRAAEHVMDWALENARVAPSAR